MTARLDRRSFLASLVALGASVALPLPIAKASPAQINQAWRQFQDAPWMFDVDEYQTITAGVDDEPKVRSDVFDIEVADIRTPKDLITEVQCCPPLLSHFQDLARERLADLQWELDEGDLTRARRKALQGLVKALADEDDGWQAWIAAEPLHEHVQVIQSWLADPIEWHDMEHFPRDWGPQGRALAFFESLPFATQQALGVEIIEGDHPGSTYFAAELRQDIESANREAANLGLPFRFRAA